MNARRFRIALLVGCAVLALTACRFGDGPMFVDFDGRTYGGTSADYYVIGDDDVSPVGTATTVDPMSAVTDTTVYQVDDIPTDRLIAMRAAPDQDTQFLLFRNLAMDFPAALCDFADSANPPSQEDCP